MRAPVDRPAPPPPAGDGVADAAGAPLDQLRPWWLPGAVASDAMVAAAVAAGALLVDLFGPDRRFTSAPLWDLALGTPLLLRRRRPTLTLALIAAVCLAQWVADVKAAGDVAFLVALFSLAAYGRRWWQLAGAIVVAELGVVMAFLRWGPATNWLLPALTATGTVSACWIVGIYMRMRSDYVASIRERAETAERDRDSRAQVAVAAERARIAREMHDVIAHSLSVMITLNDAAAAVEPSPQARQTIAQASEVGRNALEEMQRLLGVLRDDALPAHGPQPGLDALPDLVAMVRASGLVVELAVTGDMAAIPATAQLALYRIVQESLTNVVKHARGASAVRIELRAAAGSVAFSVTDDGLAAEGRGAGYGLTGMEERARLFGGTLAAGPLRHGGWAVRGRLLLHDEGA